MCVLLLFVQIAAAQAIPYQRPVDTAPQADSIGGGYKVPPVQKPLPRDYWLQVLDVVALAAAMGVSVWLVLKRRSRRWLTALTIGSLAYFGFYREGCICPIGSLQNVVVALADPKYSIPMVVTATFVLPLVVALYFGRAFCGGVCALGAIQELVVLKPVQVPRRLDRALGLLKYRLPGAGHPVRREAGSGARFPDLPVRPVCGILPADGRAAHAHLRRGLSGGGDVRGAALLPLPVSLCGLLAWCTRLARRGVTITPNKELDCGLCAEACPYGAIEKMRAVRRNCLYCARCYASCPRERGVVS